MQFHDFINYASRLVEIAGITILAGGTFLMIGIFLKNLKQDAESAYKILRRNLGKVILLGLEVLVAADIIATVVTRPEMKEVLILGLIVLIRTFLSFSIETELEGRFPWQRKNDGKRF